MGILIMLGTLSGLIGIVFFVVLRHDPQARATRHGNGAR
jgi:hypothetical protein